MGQVFVKHFISLTTVSSLWNEVTTSLAEIIEKFKLQPLSIVRLVV